MKAKDLKVLRKKLAKVNKAEFDALAAVPNELLSLGLKEWGESLPVSFVSSSDLSGLNLEGCLDLFEQNMGELYRNSSWGLDMQEKRAEFKHANARFLLLETTELGKLAGFVHFRFDYDDEEQPTQAVLYVYEIQIDESYRRQGLGKKLMTISERIALGAEMAKVLLTVFKKNKEAMDFYKRIDYDIDETSPSKHNEPSDYEILSRSLNA